MLNDRSYSCLITGICSLPSGHIIVVDDNNKKVKLFDQQYNVLSHCEIPGFLFDICLITSTEVAVRVGSDVPVGNHVQFISVINGQLINGRRFQLPHDAIGIAHHHGALYVTSGTALYHYTLSGTLVKKLYGDTASKVLKCAVSPAGDRIYVILNRELLTLAMDGTLISTFTDPELQCPQGVHVTPAGHLLVCGLVNVFKSNHTVIHVDREGKEKLATLVSDIYGVNYETSVCCNTNIDQITLGLDNNTIIVLELQIALLDEYLDNNILQIWAGSL